MDRRKTLMNYSKADLVEEILCLERNNSALKETIDQQYYNAIELLKQADIFKNTYDKSKKL